MISEEMLNSIVRAIHEQPELQGCMIGFEGNGQSRMLHSGYMPSTNFTQKLIIVEALATPNQSVWATGITTTPTEVLTPPAFITNGSHFWRELRGAGLSCGLAVVSGIAVSGGVLLEIPSAGTSTVLVVAGWTGLGMAGLQCGNGLVRSWQTMANPDSDSLQQLDDDRIYKTLFLAIDAVGIAAAVVQIPLAVRNLYAVLQRRGSLSAVDELSRLSRAERAAQTKEALRRATQTPEGRQAVEAALREAGLTQKQVAQSFGYGAETTRRATVVSKVISTETTTRLNTTIRNIISGFAGIGVSATPSSWTGSASGSVNSLIVNVLAR